MNIVYFGKKYTLKIFNFGLERVKIKGCNSGVSTVTPLHGIFIL